MRTDRYVVLTAAVILAATLFPESSDAARAVTCILCGERSVADALLNVALFIPFGYALRRAGASLPRLALTGAVLSASIELAQWLIPGRDPSLGDVLFNTTGAVLAYPVYAALGGRTLAGLPRSAMLVAVAALLPFAVLAGSALLLEPSYTHEAFYGQWTPQFENMDRYDGVVLSSRIGTRYFGDGIIRDARIRNDLLAGLPLKVRFLAGTRPRRIAPIFNIYDASAREIISMAAVHDDVLIRYRTRAATLRLNQPVIRLRHALAAVQPGDTVLVRFAHLRGGACVHVNRAAYCPVGITAARTSRILTQIASSRRVDRALGLVWLAALFVPLGLVIGRNAMLPVTLAAVGVGLIIMPLAFPLLATPATEVLTSLLAVAAGFASRRWYLKRG